VNNIRSQLFPALAVFVAVLFGLLAAWFIRSTPGATLAEPPPGRPVVAPADRVVFLVPEGGGADAVGDRLEALGIIRSGHQFKFLASLVGLERSLAAGQYRLPSSASVLLAVDALTVKDDVPVLRVTFPEGTRIEEMALRAEAAGFGSQSAFLDAVARATVPPEIAATLPAGQGLQGYLFPDTYIMPAGSPIEDLIDYMLETFLRRVTPAIRAGFAAQGLTLHEAVTLASIVEREAVLDEERALIAGVFYNRIRAGDLLGADPTVQFALALDPRNVQQYGWWKRELTQADLRVESPYNTRLVPGIPPGPIANPGLASLEAVAFPQATKMYYFVANAKKGDGSHVFAETLAEHEANIIAVGSP
jgi:UPF0755 protein